MLLLRHVEPECKHDAPQQVSTEAAFNGKIFRSCCRRLAEGVAAVSLTLALTDSDESTCDFPNRESPVFFLRPDAEIVAAASFARPRTSRLLALLLATRHLTLVPLAHR